MLRLVLAWAHLMALGIGLGAVWARASALRNVSEKDSLSRAFTADTWWGIAAVIWIGTGLARLLAGTEKAPGYYMHNDTFLAKMTLLVVILVLEVWPMATLIRWRTLKSRLALDPPSHATAARRIATISYVQAALATVMVALAVAMARGYGARG